MPKTTFSVGALGPIFTRPNPVAALQAGHLQLPRLHINHLSFVFAPYYITAESRSWSNGWDSSNEAQMVIFIILAVPRDSPQQEGGGDSEHSGETFSDTKSHFCPGSCASQWISGCWSPVQPNLSVAWHWGFRKRRPRTQSCGNMLWHMAPSLGYSVSIRISTTLQANSKKILLPLVRCFITEALKWCRAIKKKIYWLKKKKKKDVVWCNQNQNICTTRVQTLLLCQLRRCSGFMNLASPPGSLWNWRPDWKLSS